MHKSEQIPQDLSQNTYNGGYPIAPEVSEIPQLSFRQRMEQGTVPPQEMISRLRESLRSEQDTMTPEAIKDSAEIMHHFILRGILEQEQAGEDRFVAHNLLKDTMDAARIKEASYDSELQPEAQYTSGIKRLTVGNAFKPELSTREPTDQYVVSFAFTMAHEMGHAISDSIPRYLVEKYDLNPRGELAAAPPNHNWVALVEGRLRQRPGTAMTGHKQTDLSIEEERLGQGFGAIGARSMMRAMGYTEDRIAQVSKTLGRDPEYDPKLMRAMGYGQDRVGQQVKYLRKNSYYGPRRGQAQIDVLRKVTAEKGPHELVEGDEGNSQKTNPGMLGYAKPLSAEEVIETLAEAEDLAVNGPEALDKNNWYNTVKGIRDPEIVRYIKQLRAERRRILLIQDVERALGPRGTWRRRITTAAATLIILAPAGPTVVGPFLPGGGSSQDTEQVHPQPIRDTGAEK
jgi:hypothetical protein